MMQVLLKYVHMQCVWICHDVPIYFVWHVNNYAYVIISLTKTNKTFFSKIQNVRFGDTA